MLSYMFIYMLYVYMLWPQMVEDNKTDRKFDTHTRIYTEHFSHKMETMMIIFAVRTSHVLIHFPTLEG